MRNFIAFLTDQERDSSTNLYNYDARLYDPVIGRFISADTAVPDFEDLDNSFSFDPQMLSRYTYSRNNPLIYIDPTGHFLYLSGTEEERASILSGLQQIDPSVKVNKVGSDTVQVSFDSEVSVEGYEKGHELVSNLVTSDNEHFIITTDGGNTTGMPENYKEGGKGTGSQVEYNPNLESGLTDDKGSSRRPAFVGLAHELGHAEATDKGTQPIPPENRMKYLKYGSTPYWEKNSMKRENDIRKEHNLTPNTYYVD